MAIFRLFQSRSAFQLRKTCQNGCKLVNNTTSYFFHAASRRLSSAATSETKGLVLGVYDPQEEGGNFILTPAAKKFNENTDGRFLSQLKVAGRKLKSGKSRVLYGLDSTYSTVAVVNLGKQDEGFDHSEQLDQAKENVRKAVAAGVLHLRDNGETKVSVDPCNDAEAAAEGGFLSLYTFDELRSEKSRKTKVDIDCFTHDSNEIKQWKNGYTLSNSQNFARYLMDSPSNYMTPRKFCESVKQSLSEIPNCNVIVRDKSWIESMKMGSFLSVAKGSDEAPFFLEVDYTGGSTSDAPVALVGKGITFDSGGISIKPAADMDKMRADMGGAACVAGALQGAGQLGLPINIKGFIPLCENMPSGIAIKPGDVVTAMNGKTIQVDNTDAEGRLILADALCYAETFKPKLILDLATLTGAVMIALGSAASGGYTKSQILWDLLVEAGGVTGDRVWRLPLFKHYTKQITDAPLADISNVGKASRLGGSCTAAAFLQEFVTTDKWIHLDIAGVMDNKSEIPYMGSGMSGRPTRTLIKFLESIRNVKL